MNDWEDRLEKEQEELQEKIDKLHDFIFDNFKFEELCKEEQFRLTIQYGYMYSYNTVLEERLNVVRAKYY